MGALNNMKASLQHLEAKYNEAQAKLEKARAENVARANNERRLEQKIFATNRVTEAAIGVIEACVTIPMAHREIFLRDLRRQLKETFENGGRP